ncbi:MAG: hypothetical protein AB7F83_08965 [Lysobacterales bacterium]
MVPTSTFVAAGAETAEAAPVLAEDAIDRIDLAGDVIPAGTTLRFVVLDAVGSATAKIGDTFRLESRTRVLLNGVEVLPSGVAAHGEVIHADRRGMLGKPGELLLKLRTMQWQGRQVRLRNSAASLADDKTNKAMTVSLLFGVAGFFVGGDNVEIPVGSLILGDLAEPIPLAPPPAAAPTLLPQPAGKP